MSRSARVERKVYIDTLMITDRYDDKLVGFHQHSLAWKKGQTRVTFYTS